MMGISLARVLRAAWQNFWRNIWLTAATLIIMVITLFMMLFLLFANVLGVEVLRTFERKVDLLVMLQPEATEAQINALAEEIRIRPDVEEVSVVSQAEALEQFRVKNQDRPFIEESLQELGENPLFGNLSIVAREPRFYPEIARQLQAERYSSIVQEVRIKDLSKAVDKLISIISTFKQVGLLVTVAFALVAALIMFNTVRLAIYSFREEIEIMRLVGASNWFIRGPFVIESIFISLLAVIIATAVLYPVLSIVSEPSQRFFFDQGGNNFDIYSYAVSHWITVIGLQLLLAVGLAIISSWIGIRRYLRA